MVHIFLGLTEKIKIGVIFLLSHLFNGARSYVSN